MNVMPSSRKNQVMEFIPDKLPEFPLKNFEKVSGDNFFEDENLLVLCRSSFCHFIKNHMTHIKCQEHT